jgi:maltooligosyltrehalose trehalohydrolase
MHEFKVWAPLPTKVRLKYGDKVCEMQGPDDRGWWRFTAEDAVCGTDYGFLIDEDKTVYPDPRSRYQPQGVHEMSRLYDHAEFAWTDQSWPGRPILGAVLYELHIGTFSEEGTFDGAIGHLDYLVDLGITHIEVMPVNDFEGDHGWGYDGVALFAVSESYGGPDALKRFVDACHARGLSVVLDVVYNHFGPVGNYANKFGPYLTDRHKTPWGDAVNLNEGGSDEVRRFFCDNAEMWLRDYHFDGLRLDAVHEYIDRSAVNFMEQMSAEVERLGATLGRKLVLIAESDLNDPKIIRPREAGGYGMDAQWSDDFHHALFTVLYDAEPGVGYYGDFGKMVYVAKALKRGFVFDGQYSQYRKHSHGRPSDGLSAQHFVCFDQNHDQVGNRAKGERLEQLVGMDAAKVSLGLLLTAPFVPMLFMGEEFAASSPFLFFADHDDEHVAKQVTEGRKREFAAFGFGHMEVPDPEDEASFQASKLKWGEVDEGKHAEMLAWVKELIHLRRTTVALNDADFGHLDVQFDEELRTLTMQRGSVRTLLNIGKAPVTLPVLEGEEVRLGTRADIAVAGGFVALPPMTLVVLMQPETTGIG